MTLKAVLDTNIFVSILKKGQLRQILDFWLEEKFSLIISSAILKEVFEVLQRPKFNFSLAEIEELGNLIFEKALIFEPQKNIEVCSDPKDNKFIECAVAGMADYIVSGDSDLLEIGSYQKVKIISPSSFLKILIFRTSEDKVN